MTKRRRKKMQEVNWEDEARITTIRVHKDSIAQDKIEPFDKAKFLGELKQEMANIADKK